MSNLSIQVETSFADLDPLREEWDDFVLEVGSDLYLSFDYCRLWWEVFGLRRKLRIFSIREEGRLVGLLPMLIDRIQLGPVWLRVARMLGSDLVREMFIAPVRTDKAEDVYREVLSHLFQQERCDALVWGCYSTLVDTSDAFRKAASLMNEAVTITKDRTLDFPHANFPLPPTFEEYLDSLSSRNRQNYRRHLRRIQDRDQLEITVIREREAAAAEYSRFRDLYDRFHASKGRPGHFVGDRSRERFWLKLCDELSSRDGIRLIRFSTPDRVIVYDYCLKFGKGYFAKFRARDYGPAWDNLGIGAVALVELLRTAIEDGADRVESGPGHYDYKVAYGATESPIGSILLFANRPLVKWRYRLFAKMVKLFDLVYLKIWFWRIRPKLPLPPKARSKLWFRTRL